jgi:hypothetical protein
LMRHERSRLHLLRLRNWLQIWKRETLLRRRDRMSYALDGTIPPSGSSRRLYTPLSPSSPEAPPEVFIPRVLRSPLYASLGCYLLLTSSECKWDPCKISIHSFPTIQRPAHSAAPLKSIEVVCCGSERYRFSTNSIFPLQTMQGA